ncbi:MAG TPA: agmatine deiminase family protein [Gammaproteobacteria bacterium]|nr:agmatine deiminase family protein [Gammaproteobacteria bacterium]
MSSAARVALPPEWAPQSAVMLTWPHDGTAWAPWMHRIEPAFDRLALALSDLVRVLVVARDPTHATVLHDRLARMGLDGARLLLGIAPSDDVWVRDHGPVTVLRDGRAVLLDFRFNAWGGKYAWERDARVCELLHREGCFGSTPMEHLPLVVEGGALDTDGAGTLLARESSLVSRGRNPGLDRDAMARRLAPLLGIRRFLWLEHGYIDGDDTDGHIDTLARFAGPGTIVYQADGGGPDAESRALRAMAAELANMRRSDGAPYELIPLPRAARLEGPGGKVLPAGYANFLVCNGAVLVPTYGDDADTVAVRRLQQAFPGYRMIPLDCRDLVLEHGSLHCATMQLPLGVDLPGAVARAQGHRGFSRFEEE